MQTTVTNLSAEDEIKFLNWLKVAIVYGPQTDYLACILLRYYPKKHQFDLAVPMLKELGIRALSIEEQDIILRSEVLKSKRFKTSEEKDLAKSRERILSKIRSAITRLRRELFPPPLEPDDMASLAKMNIFGASKEVILIYLTFN